MSTGGTGARSNWDWFNWNAFAGLVVGVVVTIFVATPVYNWLTGKREAAPAAQEKTRTQEKAVSATQEKPMAAAPAEKEKEPEFTKRSVLTVDARDGRVTVGNDRGFIADVDDLYAYNEEVYQYALELAETRKKVKKAKAECVAPSPAAPAEAKPQEVNVNIKVETEPLKSEPLKIELQVVPGEWRTKPVESVPATPPTKPTPAPTKRPCRKSSVTRLTKAVALDTCIKCHAVITFPNDPDRFRVEPKVSWWKPVNPTSRPEQGRFVRN